MGERVQIIVITDHSQAYLFPFPHLHFRVILVRQLRVEKSMKPIVLRAAPIGELNAHKAISNRLCRVGGHRYTETITTHFVSYANQHPNR
jgi:hypothetical protein